MPYLASFLTAVTMFAGPTNTPHFKTTGQVLLANGDHPQLLLVYDGATCLAMLNDETRNGAVGIGDVISVQGREQDPDKHISCTRRVDRVDRLGNKPLPATPEVAGYEIIRGANRLSPVSVRGVLSSAAPDESDARWNWLQLNTDTGRVRIAAPARIYPLRDLTRLIDADVLLQGVVNYLQPWHGAPESHLLVCGTNGVTVLKPAPADPADIPLLTDRSSLHRCRIEGHLAAATASRVFVHTADNELLTVSLAEPGPVPPPGSRIAITSFVCFGHDFLQMTGARIYPLDTSPRPLDAPLTMTPDALFPDERGMHGVNFDSFGKVIRVEGRVLQSSSHEGIVTLGFGNRLIRVDVSALDRRVLSGIVPDSIVQVSGLCVVDLESAVQDAILPSFRGLALIPRTGDDIRILSTPGWWTPGRLLALVFVLAALSAAVLVWNRQLRTQAERRGKRLALEQLAHMRAEARTEERTRLAIELHDSLSQTLTGVSFQIESATGVKTVLNPDVRRFLTTARQMLASCRKELQGCLWDLRTRTFEEKDLTEAIQRTIKPHLGTAQAHVRFHVPRTVLSETAAHTVLRIARELVVNAVRHGHARSVRIAGELKSGQVRFSVRDDGRGFDPQTARGPAQGHFGLQGIRERLNAFNGRLVVDSRPGAGAKFTVTLNIPS